MKRDLYTKLLAWKTAKRRKPLILKGARQVGKTHLLKYFGSEEYASLWYFNFESEPGLKNFFHGSLKPTDIIQNLSTYREQAFIPEQTLIFFDEIQECPEALNSLKYFEEEAKEIHVVAAGSLLGVKLVNSKGFPVGKVEFLELHPLSFYEFLSAVGKIKLRNYLEQLNEIQLIAEPFHDELLLLLKKYMYIGGMPEVVAEYIVTQDLLIIRNIQESILNAYELDFAKHAPKEEITRITSVWQSIPRQLAKENKKFVFSAIKDSARGREYADAIQWLQDAGLILKSYSLSTPKLPLPAYGDTNSFKVFSLDVGLLAAMSKVPVKIVVSENQILHEFNGAFTENFVAQQLTTSNNPLYYWASDGKAEVDFILEHDLMLYPLEVKSGSSNKKKSLLVYDQLFNPKILLRASTMNLKYDGKVYNYPLYLILSWSNLT